MRTRLSLIAFIVLTGATFFAADKNSDNVRLVTVGQIRKIDLKKKTFEFSFALDSAPRGGFRGRGGRGRGRFPGGDIQVNPTAEIKVFTSERTLFKSDGETIAFSGLRVADRVAIIAIHKGSSSDVEALEVDKQLSVRSR